MNRKRELTQLERKTIGVAKIYLYIYRERGGERERRMWKERK